MDRYKSRSSGRKKQEPVKPGNPLAVVGLMAACGLGAVFAVSGLKGGGQWRPGLYKAASEYLGKKPDYSDADRELPPNHTFFDRQVIDEVKQIMRMVWADDPCRLVKAYPLEEYMVGKGGGFLARSFLADHLNSLNGKLDRHDKMLMNLLKGGVPEWAFGDKRDGRFLVALRRSGLLWGGWESLYDDPPVKDLVQTERELQELSRSRPENGVYPLFRAVIAAKLNKPEDRIRGLILEAASKTVFQPNLGPVSRALDRVAVKNGASFILSSYIADFVPAPDYMEALALIRRVVPRGDKRFAVSLLRMGSAAYQSASGEMARLVIPSSLVKAQLEFGQALVELAWESGYGKREMGERDAERIFGRKPASDVNPVDPLMDGLVRDHGCDRTKLDQEVELKQREIAG